MHDIERHAREIIERVAGRTFTTSLTLDDDTPHATIYVLRVDACDVNLDECLDVFRVFDRLNERPAFVVDNREYIVGDGDDNFAVRIDDDGNAHVWVRTFK